jgi:hypothetical protein
VVLPFRKGLRRKGKKIGVLTQEDPALSDGPLKMGLVRSALWEGLLSANYIVTRTSESFDYREGYMLVRIKGNHQGAT